MDRRTVDTDLDDLTLDADLHSDAAGLDDPGVADAAPTGVMAPPSKRPATRKPPARKTRPGSSGAADNGRATSPEAGVMNTSVADGESVTDEPTAVLPAVDALSAGTPAGAEDSTPTAVTPVTPAAPATPAMPADDIWSPRSNRVNSADSDSWKPAEASERPSGNAFEVPDAFSAPPMPSEATSTTPSFGDPSPPAQAYPRPAAAPRPAAPRPAAAASSADRRVRPKAAVRRSSSARQAHLIVSRVEPWSVMKFSFAVSVVAFVVLFVVVAVLYIVLSALGVFDSIQHLVSNITSSQGSAGVNARGWFSASRILGYTVFLGGINIVLITAISTIGAVIYNLTSRLIGGVEVTLKETE